MPVECLFCYADMRRFYFIGLRNPLYSTGIACPACTNRRELGRLSQEYIYISEIFLNVDKKYF